MVILINASNLKNGGGLQVANSLCRSVENFTQHRFVIVLSSYFKNVEFLNEYTNVIYLVRYNIKNSLQTLLFGRDEYLDNLVEKYNVDAVLTVFGPSRWNPKCLHLSGFALSFLVMPESPYFQRMNFSERIKAKMRNTLWKIYFQRSSKYFYTENPMISSRLEKLFNGSKVFTVTNYYNQIFDQPDSWIEHQIPRFNGVTLINISTPYPHKNLGIAVDIIRSMRMTHPEVNLRFVYTINKTDLQIPEDMRENFLFIGKVNVEECPSLYSQCDIAFQPTLLECFTASYPEAMRMGLPIVTTDIGFSRGLCGDAATYYSPLNPLDASEKIYQVITNKTYRDFLVSNGKSKLRDFDNYDQRAEKLFSIIENLYTNTTN